MSKFDYNHFYGGYDTFAVSKEKFTKEEAIEIAKVEMKHINKPYYIAMGNGYVRHRAGVYEDNEPCVGWWLEYKEHKRSCPCWVFHRTTNIEEQNHEDYEYVHIPAVLEQIVEE